MFRLNSATNTCGYYNNNPFYNTDSQTTLSYNKSRSFPQKNVNGEPFYDKPESPQSNSTNISFIDEGVGQLNLSHQLPKKMNSDSNLKDVIKKKDQSKSLFKDKNEENIQNENEGSSQLNEILSRKNFDLPEFIKTQKGSRIMQKELNTIIPQTLDRLIEILSPNLCNIMNDTYGNYFSQKLIQCCTAQQRLKLLQSISKDFVAISVHPSGTHSVQCLIEIVNLKEEEEVIKEAVKNDILKLAYDSNSTHVLQKAILIIDEQNREHINKIVLENLHNFVLDANGICVVKKMINGNKNQEIRKSILKIIENNCLEIIQNPFGNYIIQHILDEWGYSVCKDVVKIIYHNIISLSMQKFSSNVVEKCLDLLDQNAKKMWIKDIFNFSKLTSLVKNKYGNFVLQKTIQIMTSKEKTEIRETLLKKN